MCRQPRSSTAPNGPPRGTSVKISIRNLDDHALSYLRGLGELRVEGNTVFLTKTNVDPPMVNAELVKMGDRMFRVWLKYGTDKRPVLTGLKRVSKPGLRVYSRRSDIPLVLGGLGITTSSRKGWGCPTTRPNPWGGGP